MMRICNFGTAMMHPINCSESGGGGIHPYAEILYIPSGRVKLNWIDQSTITEGPCLFLLPPNTPHGLFNLTTDCAYLYFEIEVEVNLFPPITGLQIWNSLQGTLDKSSMFIQSIMKPYELLLHLVRTQSLSNKSDKLPLQVIQEIASCDIRRTLLLVESYLIYGISSSSEAIPFLNFDTISSKDITNTLMRYMETNYREPISLKTLAKQVHLNPSYVIRLFKERKGFTPFHYLHELRMNAAVSLLANSSMSIQKIVKETGFQTIHYFSNSFKNKVGVSPSVWRKTKKETDVKSDLGATIETNKR